MYAGDGTSSRYSGGESRTYVTSRMSETEGTRARPLKPHECEPFLTIGSMDTAMNGTALRSAVSFQGRTGHRSRPGSGSSETNSIRSHLETPIFNSSAMYGVHGSFASNSLSFGKENLRHGALRGSNKMLTASLPGSQRLNTHVKMPFKHDIRKPSETPWQEPAQELREMTVLATYHMNQLLNSAGCGQTKKTRGHLKKGKLKPLYPVNLSGPTIRQCRGILSETRSYSASVSRTLQRRRHIMTQLKCGVLTRTGKAADADDGTESVHRVSAASSVDDLTEDVGEGGGDKLQHSGNFEAELANMEQDALFSQELMDKLLASKAPSTLSRENTFTEPATVSLTQEQEVRSVKNPDSSTPNPPTDLAFGATGQHQGPQTEEDNGCTEKVGPAEIRNIAEEAEQVQDPENRSKDHNLALHKNKAVESTFATTGKDGRSDQVPLKSKRPLSAGVNPSDHPLAMSQAKVRPRTALSGKTVRFADHAHSSDGRRVPVSKSNSWVGRDRSTKEER